jgi:branched-chain amino acid transport system ATP-binding protein
MSIPPDTEATDEPLLVGTGLTKEYGSLVALDDVDVSLESGEIVGLIGPNGAGKTTLFNCMAGAEHPTGGTVTLHGEDITGLSGHEIARRGLGRTFQIARPLEDLTVLENVMVSAHIHTKRRRRAKEIAREQLELIGLEDKLEMNAGELTISYQRMLELARALATDPIVLFIDEIMAGLTPTEVDAFMDVLRTVSQDGRSIFIIEHDMRAIMEISDRVVVLDQGQVIARGDPQTVSNEEAVINAYLG